MAASSSTPSAAASNSEEPVTCSPRTRFITCLSVLFSIGSSVAFIQSASYSSSSLLQFCACFSTLFLVAFAVCWTAIHGGGMTRARHAMFDETNLLLTYQPRARTEGHLFQPEPPTPVPLSVASSASTEDKASAATSAFTAARDAHYANEYQHIQRVNRELDTSTNVNTPGAEQDGYAVIDYLEPDDDDDNDSA